MTGNNTDDDILDRGEKLIKTSKGQITRVLLRDIQAREVDLPDDVEIEELWHADSSTGYWLRVSSPEWDAVEEGEELEQIHPTIRNDPDMDMSRPLSAREGDEMMSVSYADLIAFKDVMRVVIEEQEIAIYLEPGCEVVSNQVVEAIADVGLAIEHVSPVQSDGSGKGVIAKEVSDE